MKIPSSFTLFGSKYEVKIKPNLLNEHNTEGYHYYRRKLIELQEVIPGHTKDAQEHAFLHELVHAILTQMGEAENNENEKFVDVFSGLLHQAIKTME